MEQAWSSCRVARTPSIAPEQVDGGSIAPSDLVPLGASESMTGFLRLCIRINLTLALENRGPNNYL